MTTLAEIQEFVRERCGASKPMHAATRLEEDLGITGDDYFELIDEYSKRFSVDIDGFLWYFHCHEEAFNPGSWFFPSPVDRVPRIAITLDHLLEFANRGTWAIAYPAHTLAKRRYDICITWLLILSPVFAVFLVVALHGASK